MLDLLLPGATGHQVTHLLRTNPEVAGTPILVLSALDEGERFRFGSRHRADAYVGKPFDLKRLLDRIEVLLARSRGSAPPAARTG